MTGTSSPVDIQAMLRKAEMQQMQLQLEVNFKRNIQAFKTIAPQIYEQFIDYEPTELKLEFSDQGYLNLVNAELNNKPVYNQDPKEFCRLQFEEFRSRPSIANISFGKTLHRNKAYLHPNITDEVLDVYLPLKESNDYSSQVPIGFMMVTGCGLGYHIQHIVENLDVYNLCIFDPHKDSFYAALHTVDWLPILQKLCTKGKMLKLFIGVDPQDAMADMKLLSDKIGLFNLVYTFVYRHFDSVKERAFVDFYRREFHLAATGTGFFDDEQISLAHTVHNLNKGFPMFKHAPIKSGLPPVLVIGNGPSLDKHIDYIKQHQNDVIIFTCGTALSSLMKTGIKPDFHIEMERSSATPAYISTGTTEEYREGIPLLALNTAPPNMVSLFEEVCLALKPNDLGKLVFDDYYPNSGLHPLAICNPTVTNAGLSFAISMGFQSIILIGVDLGMKQEGEHHSQLSVYFDVERAKKERFHRFKKEANSQKIPGNFGEDVYTNPKLHATKTNLEILLRHTHRVVDGIKVYNPNDGAFIDGTITARQEELPPIVPLENKTNVIAQLKSDHFCSLPPVHISEQDIETRYLNYLYSIKNKLKLSRKVSSSQELFQEMLRIYSVILSAYKEFPTSTLLMRGSVNAFMALMTQGLLFRKDDFKKYYSIGQKAYNDLLEQCMSFMKEHPLQPDTTTYDLAADLEAKDEDQRDQDQSAP